MNVNTIISLVSAIGVSSIVSAFLTFTAGKKKNQIDGIVTERKLWRDKIRKIADDFFLQHRVKKSCVI